MSTIEKPVQAPPVTKRDVLLRAADLLEEIGWCQGVAAKDENGEVVDMSEFSFTRCVAYCHNGAIAQAILDFGLTFGDMEIGEYWSAENVRFNDEQGRTKEEVVARLRAEANACLA